jgi:hypothetical protein
MLFYNFTLINHVSYTAGQVCNKTLNRWHHISHGYDGSPVELNMSKAFVLEDAKHFYFRTIVPY